MKKIIIFTGLLSILALFYYSFVTKKTEIDITTAFTQKQEYQRLRYFKEINMQQVRQKYHLTGEGINIAMMGEIVDPTHPDLLGRIKKQYDTYNTLQVGKDNLPYHTDMLSQGNWHGTHIAGTIAANCDGIGIQGIACNAILSVYNIGLYEYDQDNAYDFSKFANGFSKALDHITKEGKIKITTGSFNIEAPQIFYKKNQNLYGKSMAFIIKRILKETQSFNDMLHQKIVTFQNKSDIQYIRSFQNKLEPDGFKLLTIGPLLPFSKEWKVLEQSIQNYQRSGGVYLITESNIIFGKTSILNALPSISSKVDKDLWISIVMVQPKGMENAKNKEDLEKIIQKREYITPINDCGEIAYKYCILTPSYDVLSTVTARIKEPSLPLYKIEKRTYQGLSGHSMGAPMVAATLALMQEYNQKEKFGYDMRDLVSILKKSADRSFKGYDPSKHGQGILDVANALKMMRIR